jgi:pimeloyl-ACP methyl ester carboxylesterase
MPVAETSYASCGDLSLAYQVFGDGPVELVFVAPFASHVELFWTLPEFKAFFDQLATFCRVVLFDKAGLGLSDPVPKFRTLDDRATEIEAVMDTVGFEKAAIFGMSDGGPASIVFAAKRPQRTRALILYGSYPYMPFEWDDIDRDPAEMLAHGLAEFAELGEDISEVDEYRLSVEQITRGQELGRAVRSAWGSGAALKGFMPSARSIRQLAMFERMSASPGMARATMESVFRIDLRPILPTITAPTLVIHARDDPGMPVQCGRYIADHIPCAVARGRRRGPRALVHRTRHDRDRDRGVPHRQPRRAAAVPSRPAHRAIHRHRRLDATRRSDRRRAVARGAAPLR